MASSAPRREPPATASRHAARRAAEGVGDALGRRVVAVPVGVAAAVAFAALSLWVTRGATFFVDEMKFFTTDGGLRPGALLAPVNGHLSLVQRVVLGLDFRLLGADFLLPRVVSVLGVLAVAGLLAVLVARRLGVAAGLAAGVLVLGLGPVWELTYVPSGVGVSVALAAGLGALLALERGDRRGDAAACALLVVAGLAYTLGPAFMVGALALVLARPRGRRRAWMALVPLGLYLVWFAWAAILYVPPPGEASQLDPTNVLRIPAFVVDEAAAVAGVLTGLGRPTDDPTPYVVFATRTDGVVGVLAVALVAGLAVRVRRHPPGPGFWAVLAVLAAWWAALGLGAGPGRSPETVRYAYSGAVLVVLLLAEAFRGRRIEGLEALAVAALVVVALPANAGRLREGVALYRESTLALRAQLLAVELARDHVAPDFRAAAGPASALQTTGAAAYLAAVDRLGASPALPRAALATAPEPRLAEVDRGLVGALGAGLRPAMRTAPDACRTVAAGPDGVVRLAGAAPGLLLRSATPATVGLRRFARRAGTAVPVGALAAGTTTLLALPADRARGRPWAVTVAAPAGVRACSIL